MTHQVIVIGTSLGGLKALKVLFKALPEDFPIPIAVVLHRLKGFDSCLEDFLQKRSMLRVREAKDKLAIEAGNIYMAPADYHLLIENGKCALSTDEPVFQARPSIDMLFESCAYAYGPGVIGVILTGGGHDGVRGLRKIQDHGGTIIVENPESAKCGDMPASAIAATGTDQIYPLLEIADVLKKLNTTSQTEKVRGMTV